MARPLYLAMFINYPFLTTCYYSIVVGLYTPLKGRKENVKKVKLSRKSETFVPRPATF